MHSHKSSGTVHRPPTVQSSVGPMPGTSKQRTAAVRTPAAAAIRQTVTRNTDLRSHVFIRLPPKYAFLCPKCTPPPRGDVKSAFAMFPSLHGVFSAIGEASLIVINLRALQPVRIIDVQRFP